MNTKIFQLKSEKNHSVQIKETPENAYGFDLSDENVIVYSTDRIKFTVIGFRANSQFDMLIATIKVALIPHLNDEQVHLKKIDLFNTDLLNTYCRTAAAQLKINEAEVKSAIYTLRERLGKYRQDELKMVTDANKLLAVSTQEQKEAMMYLKTDNIMDTIEGLLEQAGIVTEKEKALQLFFILLSRHFEKPLHAFFQGSPQLSKMLMDVVGSCIPDEQIHSYTSMSTSSIYYTKNKSNWKNIVLHLSSIDRNFKGANTIKEFIEHGIIKHSTTENNYQTGHIYASKKVVEGTICLMTYSNDEVMNKKFFEECFFIRVNETEKNKAEMLEHLKQKFGGIIDTHKQQEAIRKLKNIQRLILPIKIVIPYAMDIQLPATVHQQLRSLPQLLTFINSVTLLHQHLLPKKMDNYGVEYIEATTEHLQIGLELFRSFIITQGDILNQNQRNLLERIKTCIKDKEKSFRIPEIMKLLGLYSTIFYKEFEVLKLLGFVAQSGGNKRKGIEYKITEWEDYKQLENGADSWSNQLKEIKTSSFPEVSLKFSKEQKEPKTILKYGIK